jgi:hypothetical protein
VNIKHLIEQKEQQLHSQQFITFTDSELSDLRPDHADAIINRFHGGTLMRIPDKEIRFFDWLKQEDTDVWNDLWEDEENMYLVSIDLLSQFFEGSSGFPICDLVDQPNYWFNARHIKPKGQEQLEIIIEKLEGREQLSLAETFLFQLSTVPTDIWHFCYQNNISVKKLKDVVEDMVYEGWLVHLTDREDLVKYIDI